MLICLEHTKKGRQDKPTRQPRKSIREECFFPWFSTKMPLVSENGGFESLELPTTNSKAKKRTCTHTPDGGHAGRNAEREECCKHSRF